MKTNLSDALERLTQRARRVHLLVLPETPDTAEVLTENGRYPMPLSKAKRRYPHATIIEVGYDEAEGANG